MADFCKKEISHFKFDFFCIFAFVIISHERKAQGNNTFVLLTLVGNRWITHTQHNHTHTTPLSLQLPYLQCLLFSAAPNGVTISSTTSTAPRTTVVLRGGPGPREHSPIVLATAAQIKHVSPELLSFFTVSRWQHNETWWWYMCACGYVFCRGGQDHYRMWFDARFPRRNILRKIDGAGGGDDGGGISVADVETQFWVTNI